MTPDARAALLLAVTDEMKRGKITEMHLDGTVSVYHGLTAPHEPNGHIFVDPVPDTLDIAVHECLHRRFPKWSEKRVTDTATRLVFGMTGAERRKLFALYQRVAKKRKGVRRVDE